MRNSKRLDRVAELIQRKLSQLIRQELKDPRLAPWISLSAVKLSPDLSYAKVYFTVFNHDVEETALVLNQASPFLRSLLARSMTLRTVPQLHFVYDTSVEYARHMDELIANLNLPEEEPPKEELTPPDHEGK